MKTTSLSLLTVLALAVVGAAEASAADWVLSPSPTVTQRTVYYAPPATVVAPTTTYYAPSVATPVTSYYAPVVSTPSYPTTVTSYYAPTYSSSPLVAPAPRVTYYSSTVAAPLPVTSYYTPTTTYYAPTTTYYAPAVATPTVIAQPGIVRSKVYYPGEPIRNFFKALAP
ncbi:MAG: hypothetical protein JNK76_13245 [Planctomycetales bacterium]|nr:hypothetical protein [Planctomycetales bacterium]MBN8627391.1 hypothetical protein [Planctomycetota bacterium]